MHDVFDPQEAPKTKQIQMVLTDAEPKKKREFHSGVWLGNSWINLMEAGKSSTLSSAGWKGRGHGSFCGEDW